MTSWLTLLLSGLLAIAPEAKPETDSIPQHDPKEEARKAQRAYARVFSPSMNLAQAIEICQERTMPEDAAEESFECIRVIHDQLVHVRLAELIGIDEPYPRSGVPTRLCKVIGKDLQEDQQGEEVCTLDGDAYEPPSAEPPAVTPRMKMDAVWKAAVYRREELIEHLEALVGNGHMVAMSQEERAREWQEIERERDAMALHLRELNVATSGEFGVVIRGGVSMGAYQAGFLYYLTNYLRAYRAGMGLEGSPFTVVAGSSAGGINSYIAAIEGCREESLPPSESLFYEVWMNLGLHRPEDADITSAGLYNLDEVGPNNLFSSKPFEDIKAYVAGEINSAGGWRWQESCDVALGLTTTRVTPRVIEVARSDSSDSLEIPHQIERFGFEVRVKEDRLSFENLRPLEVEDRAGVPAELVTRELLDRYPQLDVGGDEMLGAVLDVAVATGAFPLAFPPVRLRIKYGEESTPETVAMLDGGTFDNHPFRFASRLKDWKENGELDADSKSARHLAWLQPRPHEFIMLEPSLVSYSQTSRSRKGPSRNPGALQSGGRFVGGLLGTARSAQLAQAADELPYLRVSREDVDGDYVTRLPSRSQPVAGEHLARFLAFAEEDFRDFDFAVGIADARRYVKNHELWSRTALHERAQVRANELLQDGEPWLGKVEKIELVRQRGVLSMEECEKDNFARLVCASSDFERDPIHDLETWFELLEKYGYVFNDLFEVARGRRRKFSRRPGGLEAAEALRVIVGRLTDRLAHEQAGEDPVTGAKTRTMGRLVQKQVLRAGTDYALDGLFAYRYDWLNLDLGMRVRTIGPPMPEVWFGQSRSLVERRTGYYISHGTSYWRVRWAEAGVPNRVNILTEEFSPVHFRIPLGVRRTGFVSGRGLVAVDLKFGGQAEVFWRVPGGAGATLGEGLVALRGGVHGSLGVELARRVIFGVGAVWRPSAWIAAPNALVPETDAEDTIYSPGFEGPVKVLVHLGWRVRPMDKRGWKGKKKEERD